MDPTARGLLTAGVALGLVVLVAATVVGSVKRRVFERTVNQQVESTVATAEYRSLEPVAVQPSTPGPFRSDLEFVTVTVGQSGADRPPLAGELQRQTEAATGQDVRVRVRFISYQQSNGIARSSAGESRVERAASREGPASST